MSKSFEIHFHASTCIYSMFCLFFITTLMNLYMYIRTHTQAQLHILPGLKLQARLFMTCSTCLVWDLFCKLCGWCVSRSNSLRRTVEMKPSGMFQLFTHTLCVCVCLCDFSVRAAVLSRTVSLIAKMRCCVRPQVHPTGCCGCCLEQIDAHFNDGRWSWITGGTEVCY